MIRSHIMEAKYQFYEKVRVSERCTRSSHLIGFQGTVLGRAENDLEEWSYAIHLDQLNETWNFLENELESTGTVARREDYYDDSNIVIKVDPITGEGQIINPNNIQSNK